MVLGLVDDDKAVGQLGAAERKGALARNQRFKRLPLPSPCARRTCRCMRAGAADAQRAVEQKKSGAGRAVASVRWELRLPGGAGQA